MAGLPAAKALVERMQGKPFAFFAINNDPVERYRAGVQRHGVPWPSLNAAASDPPLTSLWGIEMFPTVLVLDQEGVIRFRGHSVQEVPRIVDGLL